MPSLHDETENNIFGSVACRRRCACGGSRTCSGKHLCFHFLESAGERCQVLLAGLAEDAEWCVQLPGFGEVAAGHHPPGGGQGWKTAYYRHTQGTGECVFQLRGTDKDRLQAFGLPVLHAGLLVSPQPAFAEGSSFFPHIGQLAGA